MAITVYQIENSGHDAEILGAWRQGNNAGAGFAPDFDDDGVCEGLPYHSSADGIDIYWARGRAECVLVGDAWGPWAVSVTVAE